MAEKENFKVAIIVCWFGNLPEYFPLWMYSCSKNENIDFLVYTDQNVENPPENVKIKHSSLEEIRVLAREKLGISTKGLCAPYKLCDLRPCYGLVFFDDLKEYTHWGHCDIDLIFGKFDDFITDEMLSKYDKIFRYGHLIIYKNTPEVNNRGLYQKGGMFSAKEVLSRKEHYSYDEVTGIDRIYRKNKYPYFTDKLYVDVSVRHKKSFLLNDMEKNHKKQAFAYENGKIIRYYEENSQINKDEWLYIHFQKKKMPLNKTDISKSDLWITPSGIYPKSEEKVTVEIMEKRNPTLTEAEFSQEDKIYKKAKMREFFNKSFREKCIHLKQRGMRIVDKIMGL